MKGAATEKNNVKVSGVDGLNLVEFPLAVLSTAAPRAKTLEFEETKQVNGEPVRQKLTITGSDKYGLPAANHHKLLVALLQLYYEQADFDNPRIEFTRYQLLKKAGWRDEGRYYKMARDALCIWKGTNLYYENSWWVDGKFKTKGFSIIDDFELYEKKQGTGRRTKLEQDRDPSYVVFGSVMVEEFRKARTKGLDYEFFLRLKYPVSRQLYRYLDKWFWYADVFRHADVGVFACEKIGLSRNYDRANQKRLLDKGFRELTELGYLRKECFSTRYTRTGGVELRKNCAAKRQVVKQPLRTELEKELENRGVTPGRAKATCAGSLVKHHSHDAIVLNIEILDWLVQQNDSRVKKNPAGYLIESIREAWPPPPGFRQAANSTKRTTDKKPGATVDSKHIGKLKQHWANEDRDEAAKFQEFLKSLVAEGQFDAFGEEALEQGLFSGYYQECLQRNDNQQAEKWKLQAMKSHWTRRVLKSRR